MVALEAINPQGDAHKRTTQRRYSSASHATGSERGGTRRGGSFGDAFDRCTYWLIILSAVVSAISIGIVIAQSLQATHRLRERTSIRVSRLISEAVEAELDDALSGPVIDVSLRLVQAAGIANVFPFWSHACR